MYLSHLIIKNHPILGSMRINFVNPKTKKPYSIIAFVGENGCGKNTILNEIFAYNASTYICEKEVEYSIFPKDFGALYLRQGSLHKNAMREVRKLIDGKDMYPLESGYDSSIPTPFSLRSNNVANLKEKALEVLEKLDDKEIINLFKEGHISDVWCSGDVSKKIDGKEHGYDITAYSSGEQEILLKLKDVCKMSVGTDAVLLDEPETSLHPRWQKEIVNLVRLLVTDSNGNVPQLFISTHSEKVLESLIQNDDTLIIRLSKSNNKIKAEKINEIDLCLPSLTFAELDYVIFHITSMDYHDQLVNRVADLYGVDAISDIDKNIKKNPLYSDEYAKKWEGKTKYKVKKYRTLPIYIRNYFHHPKDQIAPEEAEVEKSILFLRKIIKAKVKTL